MKRNINNNITLTPEQIEIYKKCSEDIIEFTKYVVIYNPKGKKDKNSENISRYVNFNECIYPKQIEVLRELQKTWNKNYNVLLAARQVGKTTLVITLILWLITFNEGCNIGIVANKKENARKIFRRFAKMYKDLPPFLRPLQEIGDNKNELELSDGTIVFCSATSRSGLRSESLTFLYLDEFAFIQPLALQQEFWEANYPVVEAMNGGGLCISSTPHPSENEEFYNCAQKANSKDFPEWKLLEIKWYDHPDRDEKWKEKTIRSLNMKGKNGEELFAREYDCLFDVLAKDKKYFNQKSVAEYENNKRMPIIEWIPDKEYLYESFKIYEEVRDQHFIIGVDISEGINLNFSTVLGLSLRRYKMEGYENLYLNKFSQAFQFMSSQLSVDDFFDLLLTFILSELNDKWFLIFELNDVGRVFQLRLNGLIDELRSNFYLPKNIKYEKIVNDKFNGDRSEFINYLERRIYRKIRRKGMLEYGLRCDKKIAFNSINILKNLVDKKQVNICDEILIKELKFYENDKKQTIIHDNILGISHFDLVTAFRNIAWILEDNSILNEISAISPLKRSNNSREKDYLNMFLNINGNKGILDKWKYAEQKEMLNLLEQDDIKYGYNVIDNNVVYNCGDITDNWIKFIYKK